MKRYYQTLFFAFAMFCNIQSLFGKQASEINLFPYSGSLLVQVKTKDIDYSEFNRTGNAMLVLVFSEDGKLVPDKRWRKIDTRLPGDPRRFNNQPFSFRTPQLWFDTYIQPNSNRFHLIDGGSYFALVILKKAENENERLVYSNVLHFKIAGNDVVSIESLTKDALPSTVSLELSNTLDNVEAEDAISYKTLLRPKLVR